jgi:polysaccharide biosynthesis protein PslH
MRILFVSNRMPYPPYRGDKLKIFNLAKHLSVHHELHLVTIAENNADKEAVIHLKPYFKTIRFKYQHPVQSFLNVFLSIFTFTPFQIAYFKSLKFKKMVEVVLDSQKFDAIHVQHLRMSDYIPKHHLNKAILDLPDAFSLYWFRRFNSTRFSLNKFFLLIEYKRLKSYEKLQIPKYPISLVCSKEDQRYLKSTINSSIELLQNGVDTDSFYPRDIPFETHRILFTGNMDYAPNVDAVEYFVKEIFPIILESVPNAEFIIAGQRPVARVLNLKDSNVHITGFIEDLAIEYAKAHILVSPLRIGAGTQNKVLEALSMNIPVVSTYVGYEGLELPPYVGVLASDGPVEFAKNCIQLLTDIEFRNLVGSKGGEHIRGRFSWQGIAKKLENYFIDVTQ